MANGAFVEVARACELNADEEALQGPLWHPVPQNSLEFPQLILSA